MKRQKINTEILATKKRLHNQGDAREVLTIFKDEAGFGRIFKPRACWTPDSLRPQVPAHYVREMRYTYGAVSPQTGDRFFLVLPYYKTDCMSIFLRELYLVDGN